MIHTFKAVGQPMLLDVGSGAVHAIDELAFDVLEQWNDHTPEEIKAALADKYTAQELDEVIGELKQLEEIGALNAPDNYDDVEQIRDPGTIKAVAAKDNITAIKIKSSRMLLAHGFLRKVYEIFESYHTSIDMICTSEVGVSMSIDNTKHLSEIVTDLKKYGTVTVDTDMCIVCVVGDMDWENLGFESRAMDALKDIPVRMVSYGGSNYNISFLVKSSDKRRTLCALSRFLFADTGRS